MFKFLNRDATRVDCFTAVLVLYAALANLI